MSFEDAWSVVKSPLGDSGRFHRGERCLLADSPEECPNRRIRNSEIGLCNTCYNKALDYEEENRDPNDNAPRGKIANRWPSRGYDQDVEDLMHGDGSDETGGASLTDDVRMLVMQGMAVMEAVREVARLNGLEGRDLMRAYTEAYR